MSAVIGSVPSATARTGNEQDQGGGVKRLARSRVLWLWLVVALAVAAAGPARAAEQVPLRLVALVDRDDQGEGIDFPYFLHYDYWASETYLISSTNRITIYDRNFFPVASFGTGRGLGSASGLTVDRGGNIYVCQRLHKGDGNSRLTIYNQAFFPVREIDFAAIPELVGFNPDKVAVAENGEIYLVGSRPDQDLSGGGVVVLTPEGGFARFLHPPEKVAPRAAGKPPPVAAGDEKPVPAAGRDEDGDGESELSPDLPAGLKPKASARRDDDEAGGMELQVPYISDLKIDRQGRIYLLSLEVSHIYVYNAREEFLFKFGEKGGADGKLSNPMGLGIDVERRVIYVIDYMRHTVLCYDYDSGRFVFEFGGQGVTPLWFNFPNSIEVDQRGRVVVSDLFNRRLQVIDPGLEERGPILKTSPAEPAPLPLLPPEPPVATAPPSPAAVATPPPPLTLAAPLGGGMPVAVQVAAPPPLPALAAGLGLAGDRAPSLVLPPPDRPRHLPARELAPRRLKKLAAPGEVRLGPAASAPLHGVRLMPRPGPVRFPREAQAERPGRRLAESVDLLLARLRALPTAVGVYGPVAVILGVGGQLLITNR